MSVLKIVVVTIRNKNTRASFIESNPGYSSFLYRATNLLEKAVRLVRIAEQIKIKELGVEKIELSRLEPIKKKPIVNRLLEEIARKKTYDLKADMQALQIVKTLNKNYSDNLPIKIR
ncbi:hypothetical protein BDZ91DRAFT_769108 [Kalaharituber pfeilii]|nr:hypothetical protein BDZ91DRAFT_769108 [Kalaharituber pfeilii]